VDLQNYSVWEHFANSSVKILKLQFGEKMKKLIVSLLALLLLLTACAGGSPATIQGQWKLVSHGSAASQTPAAPDAETSIEFLDGQLSGNVGCNGFGGEYEVDGDVIKFGPVMSTMMFCEGPVGEQEMGTIAVFQESATFVLDGDTLTITSADGSSVIVLARK
jgi:heat shock protein HslJ